MKNLYWIGIRHSDIIDCKDVFEGSICVAGIPGANHFVFEQQSKIRVDYSSRIPGYREFISECIDNILRINPDAKFMFYTSSTAYSSAMQKHHDRFLFVNEKEVSDQLNNKLLTREMLVDSIPVVPFATISRNNIAYKNIRAYFPSHSRFVIQDILSSGGKGTQLVDETTNLDRYKDLEQSNYIVSPHIEKSVPLNVHCCIYEDDVILLTPSLQIICDVESNLLYKGADFFAFKKIDSILQAKVISYAKIAAQKLRSVGFRGMCGFDFLATEDEVYFLECNPRFQSSSMLLNKALSQKGLPTLQELHISAFTNLTCPYSKKEIQELDVQYSMYSFYYDSRINSTNPWLQKVMKGCNQSNSILIYTDGLEEGYVVQEGSALFKSIFYEQIVYYDEDYHQRLQPHLLPTINYKDIDPIKTKIILLNRGVSLSDHAQKFFSKNPFDKGFDNITMTLKNSGLVVSCPVTMTLNALSHLK